MAINADTLAEESKALAVLNARLDDKTRRLVTVWALTWDQVAGELEAAIAELAAATDDGRVTRSMILRSQRLQAALAAVADSLGLVVAQTNQIITDDIRQGIEDAITAAERMLATQLPAATAQVGGMLATQATVGGLTVGVVGADPGQVAAMVTRVTQRITKTTYPLAVEAQAAIRRELLRGIAVGANPRVSARRALRGIEDQWNGGLTRALTIARTETIDAHRQAAQVVHTANADIVDRWEWTAHLDKRTCRACIAMHGERFDVTTPGPLGHQNCVLPGAVVSGPRALASTTRWFTGEVIDLHTSYGRHLAVTPNHPILTPDGWVPAGRLHKGSYVIARAGSDRPPLAGRPDDHQVPALIEDVAQTLGGALPVNTVRVPTAPEDFHGDGSGSKVHVVRTNGLLWDHVETSRAQSNHKGRLMLRSLGPVRMEPLPRRGSLSALLDWARTTSDRLMGGSHIGRVLLGGAGRHHQPVGFDLVAPRHTCGIETTIDGAAGDAVATGDGVDGFPTDIPLDDDLCAFVGETEWDVVVRVGRREYSGHVYNLQTATGWYVANDILTHNCRCARVPVTKTWEELGFTGIEEPPSLQVDKAKWFNKLKVSDQRAILGDRGFDAWQAGVYPMDQWVKRQENTGWRDSYVTTRPPRAA